MRLSTYSLAFLTGLLALSCNREKVRDPSINPSKEECVVHFTLKKGTDTKSILPAEIENRLDNAFVLMTSEDGYSRYQYFDFTQNSQTNSVEWRMPAGRDYTLYAVGNMGNILSSIPRTEVGFDMARFRYEVPPYNQITALPMAVCQTVSAQQVAEGSHVEIPISLERLMAQVNVRIDKSGITGGDVAQVLQSASIHLRQVARGLYPFRTGGSLALADNDVFSGDTDYYEFSPTEAWNQDSGEITLYVPENCQGKLLSSAAVQADKSALNTAIESLPQKGWLTYLEYVSAKNGQADGVSGSLVYRGYLGSNETNNFSIERNRRYTATLRLTWDGFTWKADGWRIDRGSDWNDGRRLAFLDADGNAINYLKIHKKGSGEAYAFFDIAAGNGLEGRKDISSYPYGWYLTGNGATLSGHDGSGDYYTVADGVTVQCLGTATVGGKAAMRLQFSASSEAMVTTEDAALRHRFGLHTMDGIVDSEGLELDVEDLPFQFYWLDDGIPNHVAQRGILHCVDPYTGQLSTEGVFHLKGGYDSKISLEENGDGTATVTLKEAFTILEDAVSITDTDGDRSCNVPLEGRVPWFNCTDLWTTYVDASVNLQFAYYASTGDAVQQNSGTRMTITDNEIATGDKLNLALVEEYLVPETSCELGKLGFTRTFNAEDGSYNINTHIVTYNGLSPSGTSFLVDEARLSIKGHASDRGVHSTAYRAWNPWKNIHSGSVGTVLDDYTLFCIPNCYSDTPNYGWKTSGQGYNPPQPADNATLNIQNPVVANEGNVSFNTLFDGTDKYLGNICSIDPANPLYKTSADFNPNTWSLIVDVTDPVYYDKQRLYDYLYGRGFGFYDTLDMDMQLSEYNHSFIIGGTYGTSDAAWRDAPSGVSASSPSSIQGTTFRVVYNAYRSEWTMVYGMKGKSKSDISTHGAGKINMLMRIHNLYDHSYLECKIAEAWMRLHIYIWPVAFAPEPYQFSGSNPHASELTTADWCYSASLWAPVGNHIPALDYIFDGHVITEPQEEIINGVFLASKSALTPGIINKTQSSSGSVTWGIIGHRAVNTPSSLREFLLDTTAPYIFKNSWTLNEMIPDAFSRHSSTILYFDPSGKEKRYSHGTGDDSKLFVLYLMNGTVGSGGIHSRVYYFGKENGF